MNRLQQISTSRDSAGQYSSREHFCRVFFENLDGLYQLSFLLTGDEEMAQQCFVAGLEDSVKASNVFRGWAHSWAKRAIIRNAIRTLRPQPADADSPAAKKSKLRIIRDGHLEIDIVLALEDFERVVFVMTVLERYSDRESALLMGCSVEEVRAARICALKEIGNLARADSSTEAPVGCGPHQLPLITNHPSLAK